MASINKLVLLVLVSTVIPTYAKETKVAGLCGGIVNTESHPFGTIISPGYPDQYPEDVACAWTLKAPQGERIELQFEDFDVTSSEFCNGDFVGVITEERGEEQRYCGSDVPSTILSSGEYLLLTFGSNAHGSCRGFNVSYHVREETLSCGVKTNALEFTFVSPGYPSSVHNDSLECTLTVDHGCSNDNNNNIPGPICQLRLDFDDFMIQPPFWGDCLYDQFFAESPTPLPTLCGNNNGSHMYVNVEGRSKTDLTFLLQDLEYYLYHCYDMYGHHHESGNHSDNVPLPTVTDPHGRRRRRSKTRESDNEDGINNSNNNYMDNVRDKSRTTVPLPVWRPGMGTIDPSLIQPKQVGGIAGATTGPPPPTTVPPTTPTTIPPTTTLGDVTVALYNYNDNDVITFPMRRAWKIRVTQIPCNCPKTRAPKAPAGCLQYFQGVTGTIDSFNFDSLGCYTEDRWCDFDSIKHVSDCDIRVGYTGHLNNLDYGICVEPESGFCGIQYSQVGSHGFSLTNISDFWDSNLVPSAQVGDMGCMGDYLWVAGVEVDVKGSSHERYCGTTLGNSLKRGSVTSFSKPFTMRMVTDSDEFSLTPDYMNRGFQLHFTQIPCKLAG